jgi:hypothetical protein
MAAWLGFDEYVLGAEAVSLLVSVGAHALKPIRADKAMEIFRVLDEEGSIEDIS